MGITEGHLISGRHDADNESQVRKFDNATMHTFVGEFQASVLKYNRSFFNKEDSRAKYFADHEHKEDHPPIPHQVLNLYVEHQVLNLLIPTRIQGVKKVKYIAEGPCSGACQIQRKKKKFDRDALVQDADKSASSGRKITRRIRYYFRIFT